MLKNFKPNCGASYGAMCYGGNQEHGKVNEIQTKGKLILEKRTGRKRKSDLWNKPTDDVKTAQRREKATGREKRNMGD